MKTSYLALAAPILAALFAPAIAMPAQSYPGCDAATNAAAIGDQTALKNAIAACAAAGNAGSSGSGSSAPATPPSTGGNTSGAGYSYSPVAWSASGNCYECGPSSQYYEPGCHCENCKYVTCG